MTCNKCGRELKDGETAFELSQGYAEIKEGIIGCNSIHPQESQWIWCFACESTLDLDGAVKSKLLISLKALHFHLGELLIGMDTELDEYREASEAHKDAFKLIQELTA